MKPPPQQPQHPTVTRRKFVPRAYQPPAIDFLVEHPRCNLWMPMGMGKTPTVLSALQSLYRFGGETEPTLVLAPKRVAQDTWPKECAKWEHLAGFEVVPCLGTAAERAAALRHDAPVHVINYDNVSWLVDHLGDRWPYGRVVPDEATRLKGFRTKQGGVRAQALGRWAHTRVRSWWNLTGTPASNGLKDLWGQQWFVDSGRRLGRTYKAFEERWFGYKRVTDAISHKPGIVPIIMPFASQQIHEALADCTLSMRVADWFDIKDPIVSVIEVDLPPLARKHYNEMERRFFTEIDSVDVEAVHSAAKSIKCLQIANGAVYAPDPSSTGAQLTMEVHDEKLAALESILEEAAGNPVLVSYQFRSDLARLQRAFPQGRTLTGDSSVVEAWNAGLVPLLFAHPASAGHGLNLQDGGNIIVFFGQWWDLEQHDQIIERIGPVRQAQSGHDRPVFIYYIVARDTVDEGVMDRRTSKRGVQDVLMDYMRRKRA